MRIVWLIISLCLLPSVLCGSASVPTDAKAIELDQRVVDFAPGAYYKAEIPTTGTLAVVLDELPADMKTRIVVINEADEWLADKQTSSPGQTAIAEARVDAPGWYYIGVMDLEGKSHESPYAFHVSLHQSLTMADLPCIWTGTWQSNFGEMFLEQDGDVVQGSYSRGEGKISGQVQGQKLVGTWSENPSYNPPDDAGNFEFTMSEDCQSFQGRWKYGSTGGWIDGWSGTRT
jgi:hypothetical protein